MTRTVIISLSHHPKFIYGYENSILQTKYVDFITSNEFWSSLVLKPEIPWQNEIIEYIKEIYTLTCQVQSSSDAFIPGYEGIAEQPELPDYEFRIHLLLCEIWHRLYLHYVQIAQDTPHPQKHLQRLKDILSYLQEHASEELSLEDIAAHAGLCKSECCRFFKKYTGATFSQYLAKYRVLQAEQLLAQTSKKISEIALETGFADEGSFIQCFRKYYGCTPRNYRKEITQNPFFRQD